MSRTKKEIDKELMYKKLMPSGHRQAAAEEPVRKDDAPNTEPERERAAPPASPRREAEARRVSVPSMDNQKTYVVNVMESLVLKKLDSVLSRFHCCRCDRCKKDIVALALNKLPPKYRVVTEGQPEKDVDTQLNAQIITALIQAVIQVRTKPRH